MLIVFFTAQYIPKNPVSRVIQCAAVASENEVEQVENVKQKEKRILGNLKILYS